MKLGEALYKASISASIEEAAVRSSAIGKVQDCGGYRLVFPDDVRIHWRKVYRGLAVSNPLPTPWGISEQSYPADLLSDAPPRRSPPWFYVCYMANVAINGPGIVVLRIDPEDIFVVDKDGEIPPAAIKELLEALNAEIDIDVTEPWLEWEDLYDAENLDSLSLK